jgi:hypothetical protein
LLCALYTTDLPTSIHTTTGTFADDTVILARHDDPVTASHKLQGHLDQLEAWLKDGQSTILMPPNCVGNFHTEERALSSSTHKQYSNSTITNCEVSWPTLGFQANVDTEYRQKKKTDSSKSNRYIGSSEENLPRRYNVKYFYTRQP